MNDKEFKALRGQMLACMPNVAKFLFGAENPNSPATISFWGKSLVDVEFDLAAEVIRDLAESTRQMPRDWGAILGEICSEQRSRKELAHKQWQRDQERAKYSRDTATPGEVREPWMEELFLHIRAEEARNAAAHAPISSDSEHVLRPPASGRDISEA